jgi:hypothetical protein
MLGSVIGSLFGITLMLLVFRKRMARKQKQNIEPALGRVRAWRSATLIFQYFQIPFGVFLGAAALVAAFAGTPFMRWYLDLCQR